MRSSTDQALSNKTLFLDGLDELRAGEVDGQRPFDGILEKLDELEIPKFRLSCRNANWFGEKDRVNPGTVTPDGLISVLHINSLLDENVIDILKSCPKGSNPEQFVPKFQRNGVDSLLKNTQSLAMLAKANESVCWTTTRKELLSSACQNLLKEHNQQHKLGLPIHLSSEEILKLAGEKKLI